MENNKTVKLVKDKVDSIIKNLNVYSIAKNFFGDEYTDVQSSTIGEILNKRIIDFVSDYDTEDAKYRLPLKNCNSLDTINKVLESPCFKLLATSAEIVIYYPKVTVTNENNKSIDITDLFVSFKVRADKYLDGTFYMVRSSYTKKQLVSNYMHSHVLGITLFPTKSCTGSGPINDVMRNLDYNYSDNPTDEEWMLFCKSLDDYVHVESLAGGPYHKLENLHYSTTKVNYSLSSYSSCLAITKYNNVYYPFIWSDFINYLIEHNVLKFSLYYNSIRLGMSVKDTVINISNACIDYINSLDLSVVSNDKDEVEEYLNDLIKHIFVEATYDNNAFYTLDSNSRLSSFTSDIGTTVCTFKGVDQNFKILSSDEDDIYVEILAPDVIHAVVDQVLTILNFKYGYGKNCNYKKIVVL